MIKPRSSIETGRSEPVPQKTAPDSLEISAEVLRQLGPNGVDAIKSIRLAARDLRLAASSDPALVHGLERADQLDQVRRTLEALLDQATGDASVTTLHGIGETALRTIPELPTK